VATIISTLFISLDGVVEMEDPEWHFPYFDEHMGAAVDEDYKDADVLLLGRTTYESFAEAWPERETAGEIDAEFAVRLGDTRKVVVTHRDGDLGWRNVEHLQGDLADGVRALTAEPGVDKVVVPGSISVVRGLLAEGLLDELRLLVHPIAARRGERLFAEGEPRYPMRLLRSEAFPTGVLRLVYSPTTSPEAPAAA